MKTFHVGGRIGDTVFALYTMKALGGGKLYVSDYHCPNWSLEIAKTMESFLRYQEYVSDVEFIEHSDLPKVHIDYDLQRAEDDYNPEAFPEWKGPHWPGNCNIRKRYAVHFGVPFKRDAVWLRAPCTEKWECAINVPSYRTVRTVDDWIAIAVCLDEISIVILDTGKHNLLLTADCINSAKVFLGCVSSCNAIAEGLGKTRFVEQAEGCFNVNVPEGYCINGWSNEEVVRRVVEACR